MGTIRQDFDARGFDQNQWQKAYRANQIDYVRRKLRTIEAFAQHKPIAQVATQIGVTHKTARTYLLAYIQGGLPALCQPQTRPRPSQLTHQQQADFTQILLQSRPADQGLGGNIWTAKLMCAYLKQTYQVDFRSGIYDLLERLDLSHQRAHADYGNACPQAQQASLAQLKETLLSLPNDHAVVMFDEFSVCERPTGYYGWARKNTRPAYRTDEKKESGSMAF